MINTAWPRMTTTCRRSHDQHRDRDQPHLAQSDPDLSQTTAANTGRRRRKRARPSLAHDSVREDYDLREDIRLRFRGHNAHHDLREDVTCSFQ